MSGSEGAGASEAPGEPDAPVRPGPAAEPKKSFNERLRDRYFGRRRSTDAPDGFDGPAESVLPKSNQMGFFGRVQRPGGFDTPPDEPVELEGPLPWELGGEQLDGREGRGSTREQ